MLKKLICLFFILITYKIAYAADINSNQCQQLLEQSKDTYNKSNFESIVIYSDSTSPAETFSLVHSYNDNNSYTIWKNLNGEISGYALKGDTGFTYNKDRLYKGHLNWHHTLIWNKLLATDNELKNYSCILTGRTRLNGKKASILRLVPYDSMKFTYIISIDDDSFLPIDLMVFSDNGFLLSRIALLSIQNTKDKFPLKDSDFDLDVNNDNVSLDNVRIWPHIKLPSDFKLIDTGVFNAEGNQSEYQEFSDGITSFRVYKSKVSSIYIPAINKGTLSVYRKNIANIEYAVVGEISLESAKKILIDIK